MSLHSLHEVEAKATAMCVAAGLSSVAAFAAPSCSWLQACGYQALPLLQEALQDKVKSLSLTRDALGLDLQNVSCVFLGPEIQRFVEVHGRIFLRNVRHGLFLVPASVQQNYAIGCPVDPSFALGGERSKNPYQEKLDAAELHGVEIDDDVWAKV